eukprot:4941980-Prymnesium_polylepis.1
MAYSSVSLMRLSHLMGTLTARHWRSNDAAQSAEHSRLHVLLWSLGFDSCWRTMILGQGARPALDRLL